MSWEFATWLIWTQLWQVTLLASIVLLLARTVLQPYARTCHLLLLIVFVKCVTPPLCGTWFSFFSWCQVTVGQVESLDSSAFAAQSFDRVRESLSHAGLQVLLGVWLVGIAVKLALACLRWRSLSSAIANHGMPTPDNAQSAFDTVAGQLACKRTRFRVTKTDVGPAVFGLWNKTLVLPESIVADRYAGQLEPIIAHELMHLRRGDTLAAVLVMVADIVWWFHPLIWRAKAESRFQCERCTDADVLDELDYPARYYANCLLTVLESKCDMHPLPGVVGMNGVDITEERLRSIMNPRRLLTRSTEWIAAACLGVFLIPGGALEIDAQVLVPCHTFEPDLPPGYKCWTVEDSFATPSAVADS